MTVQIRPNAQSDLADLYNYFHRINPALADRFFDAVDRTLATLDALPGMGVPFPLNNPGLQGLRHHLVQGFPNHIIFYLPQDGGIDVVRVLHGARGIATILEAEP
jgi:toxin ParE1/3/4